MKKSVIIFMMMSTVIMYSQKEKNGTVYKEHPAIVAVEAMQQAWAKGDSATVATYLADNFKSFDGTSTNVNDKGWDKQTFLTRVANLNKWVSYMSIKRQGQAYPDAIEYKDDDDGLWVQTWDVLRGVHNETGVKIDQPVHGLYRLNNDNKIVSAIDYSTSEVGDEIGASFENRTNGTIYNHHPYINKVRRMMGAFEHGDLDTAYSFFNEKAIFRNSESARGESLNLEESKARSVKIGETWDIISFDVNGYPDYLEYEMGNAKVVHSWWTIRLKRKSDDKKFELPIMYVHNFNDDGEITSSMAYYSSKVLDD
jgi:hypothetical protein